MPGTVTVLGEVDITSCFPSFAAFVASMEADLAGRLAGALAMAAQVAVQLPDPTLALQALASVSAQITSGGITFSFAVQADLIATYELQMAFIVAMLAVFGGGGAKGEVFQYSGTADSFGSLVDGEAGSGIQGGSPTDQIEALVIMTRYPAFMAAFMSVFMA